MSDRIVIDGVPPWDGSYDLNLEGQPLTTNEWGWIKRRAGYLPLTMDTAAFSDPEMVATLAAIAVRRGGTVETVRDMEALLDRLFDAPFGQTITMQLGEQDEDDAGPPPSSSASRPNSNGDNSTTDTASSDDHPIPTGHPPSATSESAPAMSVT